MAISLQARVVFPVDRPPIPHGAVTLEAERIVDVGPSAAGARVVDLGSVALLPGLVNVHTHLEFSHLPNPLGQAGMSLVEWIRLIIAERARGNVQASAIASGLAESALHGVSAIGDIATNAIGSEITFTADWVSFFEVIGFSRARAASAAAALVERLDDPANRGRRIGISPHAPYTVSPDLLQLLIAVSRQRRLPVAMHLAESREELELLATGTGAFQQLLEERSMWDADAIPHGSRPLDYLRLLAEAPRSLVVHGNYLNADELKFLANRRDRMSLAYCPRTHAYFQHTPYPLAEALALGVRVTLGTDSRASNPDLSLLAEMRFVANSHPRLDPNTVLRMGAIAGAEALGLEAEVGSLTPGKLANIVAIPVRDASNATSEDLLQEVFAGDSIPSEVWYRGVQLPRPQHW